MNGDAQSQREGDASPGTDAPPQGAVGDATGGDAQGTVPGADASADDAAPGDGEPEAGDASPAGAGPCAGLFCEDFESGRIDPGKWDTPTKGGTLEVEPSNVAHGRYAVHFHGVANPPATDYAYIIAHNAPAALRIHNFGRAYFYVTPQPRSIDMGLIFAGTAGFPRPTYLSIANNGAGWASPSGHAGWQFGLIKLLGTPTYERQFYPQGDIPVATWTCLQWELNDVPDSITVSVNGMLLGTLDDQHVDYPPGYAPGTPLSPPPNATSSGIIGGFVDFGFGYYDWHGTPVRPAIDLYYDDIVLDTKPVACLP